MVSRKSEEGIEERGSSEDERRGRNERKEGKRAEDWGTVVTGEWVRRGGNNRKGPYEEEEDVETTKAKEVSEAV